MAFVHLHTHSEYSLLDGANRIPDLVASRQEARHGQPGRHRPRQPARRLELLRRGQGAADPPDPRLRGLPRLRPPAGAREAGLGSRRLQPSRAAGEEPGGLPEPRPADLDRLHRRLLPPSADRQGRAGEALRRNRLPRGLPLGRGGALHLRQGRYEEARKSAEVVRHDVRTRRVLARDPAARHRRGEPRHRGHAAPGAGAGHRRGRHQRRALPPPGGRRGARRAARHRHRQRPGRPQAVPLHRTGIVREVRSGDAGALPRAPGAAREHRAGGRAVRVRLREAVLPARASPARRLRHRRGAARAPVARGRGAPLRRHRSRRRWRSGWPTSSGSSTARGTPGTS